MKLDVRSIDRITHFEAALENCMIHLKAKVQQIVLFLINLKFSTFGMAFGELQGCTIPQHIG